MNEAMIPVDYWEAGQIHDHDIFSEQYVGGYCRSFVAIACCKRNNWQKAQLKLHACLGPLSTPLTQRCLVFSYLEKQIYRRANKRYWNLWCVTPIDSLDSTSPIICLSYNWQNPNTQLPEKHSVPTLQSKPGPSKQTKAPVSDMLGADPHI